MTRWQPPARWSVFWDDPANAPLYDAAANSAGCYADAIAAIRLRLVRDGDVVPREDEPVDLITLWAMR